MDSSAISVIEIATGQVIAKFPSGRTEPHQIVLKKPSSMSVAGAENKENGK